MSPFLHLASFNQSGAGSCAMLFLVGTFFCIFNLAQAETQTGGKFQV